MALTQDGDGTVNQEELIEHCSAAARAAHSDAADNETKRDADIEVALLRDASAFRLLRQPQTA